MFLHHTSQVRQKITIKFLLKESSFNFKGTIPITMFSNGLGILGTNWLKTMNILMNDGGGNSTNGGTVINIHHNHIIELVITTISIFKEGKAASHRWYLILFSLVLPKIGLTPTHGLLNNFLELFFGQGWGFGFCVYHWFSFYRLSCRVWMNGYYRTLTLYEGGYSYKTNRYHCFFYG